MKSALTCGFGLACTLALVQPSLAQSSAGASASKKNPAALTSKEIQAQVTAQVTAQGTARAASAAAAASSPASAPAEPRSDGVLTGSIACELGRTVSVQLNPKRPGQYIVSTGKTRFEMVAETTSTGAIRLEDKARGGVWLQLGNKSMLMNAKLGQRVADECMHPEQRRLVAEMAKQPAQADLFAAPAASAAAPAPATPAASTPAVGASAAK